MILTPEEIDFSGYSVRSTGNEVERTSISRNLSELTPATEILMLKGYEWKNGEVPNLRLDEDGYFRDETGAFILFRSGVTGELPLDQTGVTNLFNSRLDENLLKQYQRSTLGKGLYTGNTPQAYPIAEGDPNRHMYAIRIALQPEDIFDATDLDLKNTPPEVVSKKIAILALSTRLVMHPPERVFEHLYGGKNAVKLLTELPYHLAYGEKLYSEVGDKEKLGPKWMLIRSQAINDVEVIGMN